MRGVTVEMMLNADYRSHCLKKGGNVRIEIMPIAQVEDLH